MLSSRNGVSLAVFSLVTLFVCAAGHGSVSHGCVGDVNRDGRVSIDELVVGVDALLGDPTSAALASFDRDANGLVGISELVAAVGNSITRCTPLPTERPSATQTHTPPATVSPTPTDTPTALPALRGRFERSASFDAAVAGIDISAFGESAIVSAMSVDLDADGLLDVLVMVGKNGAPRTVWAVVQSAVDAWQSAVEIFPLGAPRALSDIDGDGFLDLLLVSPFGVAWGSDSGFDLGKIEAWKGVDQTPQPASFDSAITPMDMDADGRTDLAVAAFGAEDRIFYQEVDGSFVVRELDPGLTFSLCPVSFDGDRVMDLIAMVDGRFIQDFNEGGAWRQVGPRVWKHEPPPGWPADSYLAPRPDAKGTPMGCAWGELDGDPDLELWLSQIASGTPIYDRQGERWVDVGRSWPGIVGHPKNEVEAAEVFWGVATVDFDGDGGDDIAVSAAGSGGPVGLGGISHIGLFVQQQTGFSERGRELGLEETGDFHSLIADDLDADGRPDLLVGAFAGLPRLYLNRLEPRGEMLVLELRGRAVEGVEVDVIGRHRRWMMRPGMQSQPLTGARPILFRGVGEERELRVEVHWRDGMQVVNVRPRTTPWIIEEPRSRQ